MSDENLLTLPVIPLKGAVLFPGLAQPIAVGRPFTVAAVNTAMESEDHEVFVVAQRDPTLQEPTGADLRTVGTRAVIQKVAQFPGGTLQVLLSGIERCVLVRVDSEGEYLQAKVRSAPPSAESGVGIEALLGEIRDVFSSMVRVTESELPPGVEETISSGSDPLEAAYTIASLVSLTPDKEQEVLEGATVEETLSRLHRHLSHELKVVELRVKIADRAKGELSREQREYVLRQQLRAIQEELDEGKGSGDVKDLREQFEKTPLTEEARKEVERELNRLESINEASPEYGMLRTWVEFALDLPWGEAETPELDLGAAQRILDEDHYGLEEIKERILEHLVVLKLNPKAKAPILCFVGPPGVGKTSLGQSVARALGRKFTRQSLGGLHDEAELRGHRRTYIGAMPGRILQSIRRAGERTPVLMLDEVDKLGRDFRGDPAAALLEILDPEQNREFRDNYLDIPFDLSKVLFITTANSLETIPGPLLDRLEVIRLSGYSEEEKTEIARRYLIPRELEQAGVKAEQIDITAPALERVIAGYTREGGVRQLQRSLGSLIRKVALRIARGEVESMEVSAADVLELLGPENFFLDKARKDMPPGVATGLAWTPVGGEVLYIEAALLPDGEGLTITGQLGDVMQESARAARSYIWSHAEELGIDPAKLKKNGIHLHVPAGAIPKDGPSAGITMATAMTSLYTDRPMRRDTTMTGEITLTGLVLPVGGIKEKILAARRAEKQRIILSKENEKDLPKLPEYVKKDVEFVLVETIGEALEAALGDSG